MKRLVLVLLFSGAVLSLSGCVVAPGPTYGYYGAGPGWCYYHPYRCY